VIMKIVILSPEGEQYFTDEQRARLGSTGQIIYVSQIRPITSIPELQGDDEKIIGLDPDFVGWKFTKEDIDTILNLKAICVQSTSFSWVDVEYAKTKNIPVTNIRNYSTEAVAEFALMMTLVVARKMPLVIKDNYKQDYVKHQGVELKGKRAGIIGLGNIGKRYAELCSGIGMEVVYWSRASRDDRFRFVELTELMSTCDVLFPAMAKNEDSLKIITDDLLSSIKSSAILVSVSKHYNHQLVLDLAQSSKIYGYAFEEDNGNPNNYQGNVLALPSIAWATDGSRKLNAELWTEVIVNAAKGSFPAKVL
jgi:lactate dehydrogenase-like 2-hydroxyacid dehydrogenase